MSTTENKVSDKPALAGMRAGALDPNKLNLREEVITLNRCAKVVKGGRRFSFSALVCVGDGEGHVGLGFGKANEVPESITKAIENAKKNLVTIALMGRTLPHKTYGVFSTAKVLLKPASKGTGLIAGSQVRKVLELAGVHDILAKSLGSDNVMNVAKATLQGLVTLQRPEQVARLRGKNMEDLIGAKQAKVYRESIERITGEKLPEDKAKAEAKAAKEAKEAAEAKKAQDAVAPVAETAPEGEK